ncbi:MAG: hypothetical protein P0Y65_03950 [Candidatus Devosia phytovorans]|uniref:Uncharacterized protein n=1 Tax=Candidatus Devosia phytovorans TaxID=3121372 RepID=A0AAJ6B081_9HYPH|nr:hypothetical protein [Devosia sp.]WEK05420.1 MAG: hypothetical protein P0Y65_03950 [Devosia sp.]
MKLDRRITNGLAWAGVLLVVGIPAADMLSAQFSGDSAEQIAVVAPVAPTPAPSAQRPEQQAAVVAPKPAAAQSANAVDSFVQSGKPLPSYITGGGAAAPAPTQAVVPAKPTASPTVNTPAPTQTTPTQAATTQPVRTPIVTDPVQVASIPPKVAPVPMPLSMRPDPIRVPVANSTPPADIILPPGLGNVPRPPSGMVDSADLEDWESGPLSEFLAQREGRGNSSATVTSDYDPNGFFLDQGPAPGRDRIVGREVQPFFFYSE